MELLKGGELFDRICGRSIFTEEEAFRIIYPLTDCLCYLHRMGIIHRDIKVRLSMGSFLTRSLRIFSAKTRFSISKSATSDSANSSSPTKNSTILAEPSTISVSTLLLFHLAPEVISKQGYTTKADMWSLGVIFYLLFALIALKFMARLRGRLPFDGNKQEDIIKAIVTGQPDYNNSAFIHLSYNVSLSFSPNHLAVQRSHQRTASEESGHASLRGGFDAAPLVRGYEHADEDHSLQAQADAFGVIASTNGPSQREAEGAVDHDSGARPGRHAAREGLHATRNALDRKGIAA